MVHAFHLHKEEKYAIYYLKLYMDIKHQNAQGIKLLFLTSIQPFYYYKVSSMHHYILKFIIATWLDDLAINASLNDMYTAKKVSNSVPHCSNYRREIKTILWKFYIFFLLSFIGN